MPFTTANEWNQLSWNYFCLCSWKLDERITAMVKVKEDAANKELCDWACWVGMLNAYYADNSRSPALVYSRSKSALPTTTIGSFPVIRVKRLAYRKGECSQEEYDLSWNDRCRQEDIDFDVLFTVSRHGWVRVKRQAFKMVGYSMRGVVSPIIWGDVNPITVGNGLCTSRTNTCYYPQLASFHYDLIRTNSSNSLAIKDEVLDLSCWWKSSKSTKLLSWKIATPSKDWYEDYLGLGVIPALYTQQ